MKRAPSIALCGLVVLSASAVRAQEAPVPAVLREIGIDQKLNDHIPLDLVFRDETGREVKLGDYFGKKPVILSLVYYECPMLCTLVLNGLEKSLSAVRFDVGKEFDVLTVSFDPKEGPELAAKKKANYLELYGREGAENGWHFLTGSEESIRRLTSAVGFRYAWDEKTQQYAHASGIMILTPDGRLARYFYGIEYPARDIQFGIMEASSGKIGSRVEQLLLYCYHYDATTGKYGLAIMNLIRALGALTVVAIGGFLLTAFRRERRNRAQPRPA